ncbi:hypothetical protein FSARC_2656 [Fusarium sarcochroum]|uniref:Serine protease n=1 Tax=Fusarium sarcochroum TaxID=1208366 RepID=A0A8H4XCN9_9HYPO|nr:hypothetical protein FSARC_2656 [Fusarium sarcochroum]
MIYFKGFITAALLTLGQVASTFLTSSIQPSLHRGDSIVRRDNVTPPIPRVQIVSLENLKLFDGERAGSSDVVDIIMMEQGEDGHCRQMDDWAIFILADHLGDKYGYLGAKEIDCTTQKDKQLFTHAGYPGDKGAIRPFRQDGVSVTRCDACQKGGPLVTDADGFPGQSGGPLYSIEHGLAWQYDVLSGTSGSATGFASGSNFVNAAAKARKEFP